MEAKSPQPGTYRTDGQALLRVPSAPPPYRLAVVLHGAGATADQALTWLRPQPGANGLLLLAPQSSGSTWDLIAGGYGPDVIRLDAALAEVFRKFPVEAAGVAIAGFSDGASYALTLGLSNGDLFGTVLAFSPGFMAPMLRHGRPRIFISHGTADRVLPIERCSRRIVRTLRDDDYPVTYREFPGGHDVPADIAAEALRWWSTP
ncbi:alpha/beta hydrolase-fold protein [Streptomyces ficellus]|uniref:Alpha/beta hydrolase-fold protein n=1 Tax=Streptomyces ficellus TaxID=1977088 RepID=A0ABT7Z392_9ACTN|nr:alpha/beta hydrolase-fold protein [Streptomyces ficellus]MDN3293962.1 alpha/beta hydrolase-fold protein [Streptomyces ficellus]